MAGGESRAASGASRRSGQGRRHSWSVGHGPGDDEAGLDGVTGQSGAGRGRPSGARRRPAASRVEGLGLEAGCGVSRTEAVQGPSTGRVASAGEVAQA
jgi:hypothetical protein